MTSNSWDARPSIWLLISICNSTLLPNRSIAIPKTYLCHRLHSPSQSPRPAIPLMRLTCSEAPNFFTSCHKRQVTLLETPGTQNPTSMDPPLITISSAYTLFLGPTISQFINIQVTIIAPPPGSVWFGS